MNLFDKNQFFNDFNNFEDRLMQKMKEKEVQMIYDLKQSKMDHNEIKDALRKFKNPNLINKEYHDTDIKSIDKEEAIKKYSLNDFNRSSISSSFNFYHVSNGGTPQAMRNKTQGYVYKNINGEIVCRLICETRNEKVFITDFYINPLYMGYGLANELLKVARNTFSATGAIVHRDNVFCLGFFKRNNFIIIGKRKEYLILSLENNVKVNKVAYNESKIIGTNKALYGTTLSNPNKNISSPTTYGKNLNLTNLSSKTTNLGKNDGDNDCIINSDSKTSSDDDSLTKYNNKENLYGTWQDDSGSYIDR